MNYEMAYWLLDLCTERYLSTRHVALQVEAANFIANYDLEKWDADARQLMIDATEDPRLRFTARKK